MPPLTLTAFVDREARDLGGYLGGYLEGYLGGYLGGAAANLGGYLGGAAAKAAAAAAPNNKRPPSSGGRGVNVNPDVSAIEMDAAYGSRPSSSASSVRDLP